MLKSNVSPAVAYAAAKGGSVAARKGRKAAYSVARRIPWWGWGVGILGTYFGAKYLWGKVEDAVAAAPDKILQHGLETSKKVVAAAAAFMKYTFDSMLGVAQHIKMGIQELLGMENKINVAGTNEAYFNMVQPKALRDSLGDICNRYMKDGYISSGDWKTIVIHVKRNNELKTIGKSFTMLAPGVWPQISALYDKVKSGKAVVVPVYDLMIGEIAMKARNNKAVTQKQMIALAAIIKKGKSLQSLSKDILILSDKGKKLANELNSAVKVGDIKVV